MRTTLKHMAEYEETTGWSSLSAVALTGVEFVHTGIELDA